MKVAPLPAETLNPTSLVLLRQNYLTSRKHPSKPKEDHELITNPVGALADCVDTEVQVSMVTETFHCNWIS